MNFLKIWNRPILIYIKIQSQTIDLRMKLWGINPHKLCIYSPEPHTKVYCFRLNFNTGISKLVYCTSCFSEYNFSFLKYSQVQEKLHDYLMFQHENICAEEVPEDLSWSHFFSFENYFQFPHKNFCHHFKWYHWLWKFAIFFQPIII